jgi:eukaryotic-like serine/threonine-protein kinase
VLNSTLKTALGRMKASATDNSPAPEACYSFGLYVLDPGGGTLTRDSVRVRVQEQPFQLLLLLVERAGQIVSREEIRNRLWPQNTFVEFDKSLGVAVLKVREALGDDAGNPRFIETIPRRGYRFIAPVKVEDTSLASVETRTPAVPDSWKWNKRATVGALLAVLVTVVVGVGLWLYGSRAKVSEHAAIVIGDFENNTGDPVFDGSLRRALIIHLRQSPYLNLLPDEKLRSALQALGRSPDDSLTPALASQVCQRLKGAALIVGSIRTTGRNYTLSLDAGRCSDGASLIHQTFSADNKEQVLPRLSSEVDHLRRRLGESRESLQKFDVPMEQATTSSLEALKAYQLGLELRTHSKNVEARAVLKTAITLDPNFAIAYAQLGSAYSNSGDATYARQYFQKAFELRARATEPERLYITGRYFDIVTGEREHGSETYKLWTELYPNDWLPYNAIANNAVLLGRYETAVDSARKAVELGPSQDFGSSNLIAALIGLNHLNDAKSICEQLLAKGRDNSFIHLDLFAIASLEGDQAAIDHQLEWAGKHPDDVGMMFARGSAAASEGKIEAATRLFDRTAEVDISNGDSEAAAIALVESAEMNSEMGRSSIAKRESERALTLGKNEMVYGLAAMVALRQHDLQSAQLLMADMDHDHPLSTFNLGIYSPIIRTFVAISKRSSPSEVKSLMEPALPYESGSLADMLPIYVRGVAYLAVDAPAQAEAEFQKISTHHSIDATTTLYPLSVLGIARCYSLQGRKAESREAYLHLFHLWKDADKDLPILLTARAEFRALGS